MKKHKENKVQDNLGQLVESTEVGMDIRQDNFLNYLFFNLAMNKEINSVNREKGYRMGNKEIKILCYADSIVLIARERVGE